MPVGEPEQEPAQKGDDGESLLLHQRGIGRCPGGLHLRHRGLADRHEAVREVLRTPR